MDTLTNYVPNRDFIDLPGIEQFRLAGRILASTLGISCNAICPGPFLTEMYTPIAYSDEAKKFIVGAVALERWGKPEEI